MKILALILIVAYQYIKAPLQQNQGMKLPAAVAAEKAKKPTLSIKVAQDGSISHGGKKITAKELTDLCQNHKKKHPDGTLSISAHKQSRMDDVRIVLNTAAQADLVIVLVDLK